MINLESQGKDHKTLQMNIAPSSMTRRRYNIDYVFQSGIAFWLCFIRKDWCYFLLLLNEGRAGRRWNFLVVGVTFCPWKHVMGFSGSMYRNMGDILIIWLSCKLNCLLHDVFISSTKSFVAVVSLTRCPHIPIERSRATGVFLSDSQYKHGWVKPSCP